jgi:hypothetical protein
VTADQREQALATIEAAVGHDVMQSVVVREAFAFVRAALTPPPLPADLAEIQARADAATPGPWRMTSQGGIEPVQYTGPGEDFTSVAAVREDRDWAFITHARTDVPVLVAELAEWRARPTLTTIDTPDEVDALPPGSVVLSGNGIVCQSDADGSWSAIDHEGTSVTFAYGPAYPYLLLYQPPTGS